MLLTLKDVAKELQCNYQTVRKMVADGVIAGMYINERCIRIHPDSLDSYIENKLKEATLCKQQRTKQQEGINSGFMTHKERDSTSRRQRISQRALLNERRTK